MKGKKIMAEDKLQRELSNRHIQLIAIGGAIGTGLFLGSGESVHLAGPSILLTYVIVGFVLFMFMRAMGEILLSNLGFKSFGDIAHHYIGPIWIYGRMDVLVNLDYFRHGRSDELLNMLHIGIQQYQTG